MCLASLHRWTLLAAVATTMLTGCAWAPGALYMDPWIHHRNYRAAKAAYYNYGRADLGPWAPLCKDFETGWRQGYYDVANGMDGQRPITPPRRYWAARYQSPAGQKQVEAWFAGYELGAAAAQRDGIGYWAFVPTSMGVPAQERIEEHGTVGYRVMPEDKRGYTLDDRDVAHPESVYPTEPERIEPRRARPPRTLPTPAPTETETETPLPLPERAPPRTTPKPADTPAIKAPPVEAEIEPETTPTEEVTPPAAEPDVLDEPADESADPFANPLTSPPAEDTPIEDDLPDAPLQQEPPVETPAAPADEVEQPLETDDPDAKSETPVEFEPADPGTGAPAIPRRDINWPPKPSTPRQRGQTPVEGELPKGLDTDEPLPEEGAAIMRRPQLGRPSSVKTLAAGSGSNRLRLAPAETKSAQRLPLEQAAKPALAKRTPAQQELVPVAAEEPIAWAPRVQPAVHTEAAPPSVEPIGDETAGEEQEPDPSEVLEGLRQVTVSQRGAGEAAIVSDSGDASLSEDDLFSGLSELAEGDAE
jgi:hypothetical protein